MGKLTSLLAELLIRRPPRGNGEINFSSPRGCINAVSKSQGNLFISRLQKNYKHSVEDSNRSRYHWKIWAE